MGRPARRRPGPRRGGVVVVVAVLVGGCSSEASSRDDDAPSSPSTSIAETLPSDPPATTDQEPSLPEDLLLPNMRSLAPRDLQVVREEGQRRLRFAGLLANLGAGPMVVRPAGPTDCARRRTPMVQVVWRDATGDGAFQPARDREGPRRPAGCTLDHPTHDHWHFDAMARYTLRTTSGRVVASRPKVSFCLRDNQRVTGATAPRRRSYFGECTRRSDQGISPGWVDVYSAGLDGQWLRLPSGPGTYCLEVAADPRDQLLESDEDDNATVVGIRVAGGAVRRAEVTCA